MIFPLKYHICLQSQTQLEADKIKVNLRAQSQVKWRVRIIFTILKMKI